MIRTQAESLEREKTFIAVGTGTLLVTGLSGISTYIVPGLDIWQQWTYLAHTLAGTLLTLVLLPYSIHHTYRTLGARRPVVLLSGLAALLVLLLLVCTGFFFAIQGQTETTRSWYEMHVLAGFIAVGLMFMHLLLHRFTRRRKGQGTGSINYLSLESASLMRGLTGAGTMIFVIFLLTLLYGMKGSAYSTDPAAQPYEHAYGTHPFRPSQTETVSGGFVDARQIANSTFCSSCHEEIFKEWKASIHSQAASDRAYMTNVSLLADKKGISATRYCEGCHAPVALLSGELSPSGQHGGVANTLANMEGVSCMGCHGIVKAVHLKGVASYEFRPADEYLFSDTDNHLASIVTNFLIRIHPEEHRLTMAPEILSSPTLCATCHAQFMDKDMNNWGWVKMQDEYSAWLNSHYSASTNQTFSRQTSTRCQDCHMPLVKGEDPSANKDGMIVSHRSIGANTAIPYYTGDQDQLLLTREFLQADKMRIAIEKPWRTDATRSNQHIPEQLRARNETPDYFYLGETTTLRVTLTNQGVGHDFPGGTIDINEAWIDFSVTDSGGNEIYRSGAVTAANDIDENAIFYRALAIDRKGEHVWKHDLFNMTGDSYRNVIRAGESDTVDYAFSIPAWAKGPLTASAVLRYRKFNNQYARWALQDNSIELPIVDMARYSLTIPVIGRPAASDRAN